MGEKLWGPQEVADYCDVPVATVYTWNHKGTGPRFVHLGRHVRYRPADVEAWIESRVPAA